MPVTSSRGFTIIELAVSVALIAIITSISFFNYGEFSSRSTLRIRAAELAEYLRFAQERSAASKILSKNAAVPTAGFQVVRLKVREGMLKSIRLEQAAKISGVTDVLNDTNSPFKTARDKDVPGGDMIIPRASDRHYVDICFISSGTPKYTREKLLISASDTTCTTDSMLCSEPDPTDPLFDRDEIARNNFDIHFSVEQPTRGIYTNAVPVSVIKDTNGNPLSELYRYYAAQPNGSGDNSKNTSDRMSDAYVGVRVVFIEPGGLKRSVDVYTTTGLIGTKASDNADGCS